MNTPVSTPVLDTPPFYVVVEQYKLLSHRAKGKIKRSFNVHFGLSEDDSTFHRLIGGTLKLCVDEYNFLYPLIGQHYAFFVNEQQYENR